MQTSIVLADDHPLVLEGTRQFLENKGYNILAMAKDGNEAYNEILKHQPQIAILDFDMPKLNGIDVANLCKQNALDAKIIILTLYMQEAIIKEVGHSIYGYITKEDALSELELCISKLLKGETYISKNLNQQIHLKSETEAKVKLTPTELKILRYLAKNYTSSAIADTLFVSKRTVEKHRSNIIKKLGITSSQNALLIWLQKNPHILQ